MITSRITEKEITKILSHHYGDQCLL